MKKAINWIVGILLLIALIICGLQFYYIHNQSVPEHIYLHDTVTITKDSIITKIRWKTEYDTIIDIQVKDSIIHDTIRIPIEHKVDSFTINKDSLSITEKIKYHGYKAEIDSIELDYKWNYEVPKPKKIGFVWFIGPSVTGGVNFNVHDRTFDYGPSVGVSVGVGIGGYIETKSK